MKKVLVVSYLYPPHNSIGALRISKFVKYLPHFGWEPIVITIRERDTRFPLEDELSYGRVIRFRGFDINEMVLGVLTRIKGFIRADDKMCENYSVEGIDLPVTPRVWRFLESMYVNLFYWPDANIGWFFMVKDELVKLCRSEEIDLIFSSSLPVTCHIVASYISRRTGLPWVADFRDLWAQDYVWPPRWYPKRVLERILEKWVIKQAQALTTVSGPLAMDLKKLHKKDVFVIHNGYDESDFERAKAELTKQFICTHTGTIYAGKTDPSIIFGAIRDLTRRGVIEKDNVELRFVGKDLKLITHFAKRYGLEDVVKCLGFVAHETAIEMQKESQVLILLVWLDGTAKGRYSGKIFEYLRAKRPILAVALRGGVIDALLKESKTGWVVDTKEAAITVLEKLYKEYRERGYIEWKGDLEVINKYSRRNLTEKLVRDVFNRIS